MPNSAQRVTRLRSNRFASPRATSARRGAAGASWRSAVSSCSGAGGTDLRARSAIALLSFSRPRRRRILLLDRVAQILFHDRELRDHQLDMFARDTGQRRAHQFVAEIAELLEQRPGFGGEVEKLGAAI